MGILDTIADEIDELVVNGDTMTPYQKARAAFDKYAGMDTPHVPEDPGSAMQVRLCRWQQRNFRHGGEYQSALGMTEEVGELAEALIGMMAAQGRVSHAILKGEQRIRGFDDREKVREHVADAIADISVYAQQLCTNLRLDYATLVRETANEVMERDWKKDPVGAGG